MADTPDPQPPAAPAEPRPAEPVSSAQGAPTQDGPGCLPLAGIGLFGLTWLGPLVILGWLILVGLTASVAGRLLNQAQVTRHSSFDGGFWLGLILIGLFAVIEAAEWILSDAHQPPKTHISNALAWWPLAASAVGAMLTWLWQLVMEAPTDDLGFAAAATLLLGAGMVGSVPLLFRLAAVPIRLLWAGAKHSTMAAGVVAGGTLVAGALAGFVEYAAVPSMVEAMAEEQAQHERKHNRYFGLGDKLPEFALNVALAAADRNKPEVPGANGASAATANLPVAATVGSPRRPALGVEQPVAPPRRPAPLGRAKSATNRCVEELGANCAIKPCAYSEVSRRLRRSLQPADADFVANVALFEACLGAIEGQTPAEWRGALFQRAEWREVDELRRQVKACQRYGGVPDVDRVPELDGATERFRGAPGERWAARPPSALHDVAQAELRAQLATAMCTLSAAERCVLEKFLEDTSDAMTAILCGATNEAAVRQQRKRALDRLRGKISKGQVILEFDEN